MRVAIDLTAAVSGSTQVYAEGFLPALARAAAEDELLAFVPTTVGVSKTAPPRNLRTRSVPAMLARTTGSRLLWAQTALPLALRRWRADVLFAAWDVAPICCHCPVLLAIRNAVPTCLARQILSWPRRVELKFHVLYELARLSARRATLVFYPSTFASRLLGDAMGVPESKRAVVHHGHDPNLWSRAGSPENTLARYGVESGRYFLFVSQLYQHKQPDVLIRGFAQWRETSRAEGARDMRLILVGKAYDPVFMAALRRQVRLLGLDELVTFTGHVQHECLPALYRDAMAFVLPTILETFCLPFVEAMASGALVVAADTLVAREVCGDAALYFAPGSDEALAVALERITTNVELANSMREAGRIRAANFSWEREALETLDLIRRVARTSPFSGRD